MLNKVEFFFQEKAIGNKKLINRRENAIKKKLTEMLSSNA